MKKKLVIILAAALLFSNASITKMAFAATNTKKLENYLKQNKLEYPSKLYFGAPPVEGNLPHSASINFDISNSRNKKINLTDIIQGDQPIAPEYWYRYFSLDLYDPYGNLKQKVTVKGTDSFNTLAERLKNTTFKYGDHLILDHQESDKYFKVQGKFTHSFDQPLDGFIPRWILANYQFAITEGGLRLDPMYAQVAEVKESYWDDTYDEKFPNHRFFTLNIKFGVDLNGLDIGNFDKTFKQTLLVKNSSGEVVKQIEGVSVNWYSDSPNNYDGSQFIFSKELLEDLKDGTYKFSVKLTKNNTELADIDLVQNDVDDILSRYIVYNNINDTSLHKIGNKTFKFKTSYATTGDILLEVKTNK